MFEAAESSIKKIPNELDHDAIGVWHIVSRGQSLGLSRSQIAEFLNRAILGILAAGGVPVVHVADTGFDWTHQPQYGVDHGAIAKAIVAEWQTLSDSLDSIEMIEKCPWFARPDPKFSRFVDMAVRD